MSEQLVLLSALCALEAVPLRFNYFAAFWRDVANTPADSKLEEMLLECSVVTEYIDAVLLDERDSLEDPAIYEFMQHYCPKVGEGGSAGACGALAEEVCASGARAPLSSLLGAARALALLTARHRPPPPAARALLRAAHALQHRLQHANEEENTETETPAETASEPVRCHTPEGSEPDEQLDEIAADLDESPDEEPTPQPPRGREYITQLTLTVHQLTTTAQQLVGEG